MWEVCVVVQHQLMDAPVVPCLVAQEVDHVHDGQGQRSGAVGCGDNTLKQVFTECLGEGRGLVG